MMSFDEEGRRRSVGGDVVPAATAPECNGTSTVMPFALTSRGPAEVTLSLALGALAAPWVFLRNLVGATSMSASRNRCTSSAPTQRTYART